MTGQCQPEFVLALTDGLDHDHLKIPDPSRVLTRRKFAGSKSFFQRYSARLAHEFHPASRSMKDCWLRLRHQRICSGREALIPGLPSFHRHFTLADTGKPSLVQKTNQAATSKQHHHD